MIWNLLFYTWDNHLFIFKISQLYSITYTKDPLHSSGPMGSLESHSSSGAINVSDETTKSFFPSLSAKVASNQIANQPEKISFSRK